MVFLAIIVSVMAFLIFGILYTIVKKIPKLARTIEIFGYLFLIISLIWTGVSDITVDSSEANKNIINDEKLNILWQFEREKVAFTEGVNVDKLSNRYSDLNEGWEILVDNSLLEEQAETSKTISYILFVLSSLLIAAGRIGELVNNRNDVPNLTE